MELWNRWGAWFTHLAGARPVGPFRADADAIDELPIEPERPWGCGWFESSLDLREGLAVIEHAGIDLRLAVPVPVRVTPGEAAC